MKRDKGLYVPCMHCKQPAVVDIAHVAIRLYLRQPWISWAQVICDKCNETSAMFFGPKGWKKNLVYYHKRSFGFITEDFPTKEIIKQYETVYHLKRLKRKKLTPSQINEVAFFAYLLDQGEQP